MSVQKTEELHTGVGVGDLVDLVGVEPDLPLTALEDRRGKPLLGVKGHPASQHKFVRK